MEVLSSMYLQFDQMVKVRQDDEPIFLYLGVDDIEDRFKTVDLAKGYSLHPGSYMVGQAFGTVSIPKGCLGIVRPLPLLVKLGLVFSGCSIFGGGFSGRPELCLFNFSNVDVEIAPYTKVAALDIVRFV